MKVLNKPHFIYSLLALLFIAIMFWTQSRFPALDEKAQMGDRTHFSALAFETTFPLSADQTSLERIIFSFANWTMTNWQGMTFGLLFGATFLALLTSVSFKRRSFSNSLLNSLYGSMMGAPMGVCANCATPVAMGMMRGGLPPGVALAGLSASPTLNVIVLTMSFSLLPLDLVLLKYLFVFIFLLFCLPLLARFFAKNKASAHGECAVPVVEAEGGSFSFIWLKNLLWLVKVSVPFMLLAGFLGVLVAEFVPSESLNTLSVSFVGLLLVSILATFFPVPIAFDVIVSAVLLSLGVDIAYVAAIFFALGIFSIYPAMVIARDVSVRLSLSIFISVVSLAIAAGFVSHQQYHQTKQNQGAELSQLLHDENAKDLIRYAEHQCNNLASSQQQGCFDAFVRASLFGYFGQDVCDYLEQDSAFHSTCNTAFSILNAIDAAEQEDSVQPCEALASGRNECLYQLRVGQALSSLSIGPCLSLKDSQASASCQQEVLAISSETYEFSSACEVLPGPQRDHCVGFLSQSTKMNRIMAQHSLEACSELDSSREVQYCQGVVMVNLLEQGAERGLCEQIDQAFLRQRCLDFSIYFEALKASSIDQCALIGDSRLAQKCRWDWVQETLADAFNQMRLGVLEAEVAALGDLDSRAAVPDLPSLPRAPAMEMHIESAESDLHVASFAHNSSPVKSGGFKRLDAHSIGLEHTPGRSMMDHFEPFRYGRGIASGDINADHWPDLAMATRSGVEVYRNTGGRFVLQQRLVLDEASQAFLVAFQDLNQDGALDLIVSYYGGKIVLFINHNGRFSREKSQSIHHPGSNLTMAMGFSDPDRDGDLDIVLGGWSFGDLRHFRPIYSANHFMENLGADGDGFMLYQLSPLEGPAGETLSVLISDLDNDGQEELLIGNDRDTPDLVYRWQQGRYRLVKAPFDGLPEISSFNTMSLDSGDINNDGKLDFFSADMTFGHSKSQEYCSQSGIDGTQDCQVFVEFEDALVEGQAAYCQALDGSLKRDCLVALSIQFAKESGSMAVCAQLSAISQSGEQLCRNAATKLPPATPLEISGLLEGRQRNVLMVSSENGFVDGGEAFSVEDSFWSWNSRIEDLDNDGWQDILVGNGYALGLGGTQLHSNVFFHNNQGSNFQQAEEEFGLVDYLNTPSYTLIDYDFDGDLDVISNRFLATPGVFENRTPNASITISVESDTASIGSKLIVRFNDGGLQMRELKASGGFLSFDNHGAYLGVGGADRQIDSIEILWPNGERSVMDMTLVSNRHYIISR